MAITKVSVIIPTHSRPHLLSRAIESARRAGANVEVIVVDDASTDETARVCRRVAGIKCIRLEHNQGVAGARNAGILASSADYLAFLDDDDLRLPGSVDCQMEALLKNKEAGFVCGSMLLADQEGHLTGEVSAPKSPGGDVFWELLELSFPALPGSVIIRKACFTRVGLFQTNLSGIDDWDIFVRIAELYPVVVVNQPVSIYRKPTPSSAQGSSAQARHLQRAARHQLRLLSLPRASAAPDNKRREARRRAINNISAALLRNAALEMHKGSYTSACGKTLAALRLNPLCVLRPEGYRKLALALSRRGSS